MNNCIFTGHISREPELKFIPSTGLAVTKFGLAVNYGWGDKKTVSYLNMTAFAKTAEAIANYTDKGSKVGIESRVQTGSYEKKDGTKAYTTDFIVEKIEFLSKKETSNVPSGNFDNFPDDDVFTPVDDEDMESIPF